MERGRLAGIGCVLGVIALFGCAPPPPAPQAAAAPPPPPPPPAAAPVALVPPPAPVAMVLPPPPPPPPVVGAAMAGHQGVSVAHRVIHHHWVRRYASLGSYYYGPPCGSVMHPCGVSHTVIAIQ